MSKALFILAKFQYEDDVADLKDLLHSSIQSIILLNDLVTKLTGNVADLTISFADTKADMRNLKTTIEEEMANLKTSVDEKVTNLRTSVEEEMVDLKTTVDSEMANLKNRVEEDIADSKTLVEEKVTNLKTLVDSEMTNLKTSVDSEMTNLKTSVDSEMTNLKTSVDSEMTNLKTTVEEDMADLKATPREVMIVSGEEEAGEARCARVCAGTTGRGTTTWRDYSSTGVTLSVDISECGFVKVPTVTTSIEGSGYHWKATGQAAVYTTTTTSFDMYLDGRASGHSPQDGNGEKWGWNVEWVAVGYIC